MSWKLINGPKDGDLVTYVGVHAVRWHPEWGKPTVAFAEVDDDESDLAKAREEIDATNKMLSDADKVVDSLRAEVDRLTIAYNQCRDAAVVRNDEISRLKAGLKRLECPECGERVWHAPKCSAKD